MANLSKSRVTETLRPFSISGIDYAGPLQMREGRRRGRFLIVKLYLAVFVCFSTRAVHFKLVTALTTEAFLAALRRFMARRGLCSQIYSDNATNFVGAARELREVYEFLTKNVDEISNELAKIEAVLNSKPLTLLSSDPSDMLALTPTHFLIGSSLLEPVQHNFARSKWFTGQENIEPGTMVLVKDNNLPPLKWILGRVTETFPGDDGIVQVATIKTSSGLLRDLSRSCAHCLLMTITHLIRIILVTLYY
ncbi:uncharacterized protein LOC105203174 [Solenopsis invicta]|uniref:uncharacterized protein LOC105203174 n=1 Tax=Solenopsis invicta TaxID=13686 RepID=UPI00193CD6B2|nr:uncharacterized protein LOC105203174 [Solenopsis invicta]